MSNSIPKRITIYVGPAVASLIQDRRDTAESSVSGIIASVAERYQEAIRRHLPKLTVNEWAAILEALNGVWVADTISMAVGSLEYGVSDFLTLEGGKDKWGIDSDKLIEKIRNMSGMERLALIDTAERFWGRDDMSGDLRACLEQLVGKAALED